MALSWVSQGPDPILGGFNVAIGTDKPKSGPQSGAVISIVPDPKNEDILWAATTNGGIWKTTNATAEKPTWTTTTDNSPSLSIGSLSIDPTDTTSQTLVAGIGTFSSLRSEGDKLTGLLLTKDGGTTWNPVGTDTLKNKRFTGVAIRGNTILAAAKDGGFYYSVPDKTVYIQPAGGLFRSTNGGQDFVPVSGLVGTNFSSDQFTDLVGDPGNNNQFFAASLGKYRTQQGAGVFVSSDLGETWKNISSNITGLGNSGNIKIAVYSDKAAVNPKTVIYVGVIGKNGQLSGFFRSENLGQSWTAMDLPTTTEGGGDGGTNPGVNPGGQGLTNFAIAADPNNANIVYVSGDRQPAPIGPDNSSGATSWNGRIFQGDASQETGKQWTPVTNKFAQGTAPHADSRNLVFDTQGNLLEGDDGGIYKLQNPNNPDTRKWTSLIGNLGNTELISADWDANNKIVIGGAQDNGASEGRNDLSWQEVNGGDGGIVRVDDLDPTVSYRYSSSQYLGGFQYRQINNDGKVIKSVYPELLVTKENKYLNDKEFYTLPFTTPLELNKVVSGALVIGSDTNVYESKDKGKTLTKVLDTNLTSPVTALAYGGKEGTVDNPDVLYVAAGNQLYLSTNADQSPQRLTNYIGASVVDLVLDPNNWKSAYALDSNDVWRTLDAGISWTNISGNLTTLSEASIGNDILAPYAFKTIEYVSGGNDGLLVGGLGGVYSISDPANSTTNFTWSKFGTGLPNSKVTELNYDVRDDLLVAATLGRGAWTATSVKAQFGGESTNPPTPPIQPTTPTLYVSDAEAPENITKDASDGNQDEGDLLGDGDSPPGLDFVVGLNGPSQNTVTVVVNTVDGTAKAGEDYEPITNESVTFAPGETQQTVTVYPIDNVLSGSDKTFFLKLSNPVGAEISTSTGTGTIEDDEINNAPTDITLDATSVNENVPINTIVGNFSTTDQDVNDTFNYSLVAGANSTDNAFFSINNQNQLEINTVPNFDVKSSYNIRVRTTDQGELSFEKPLTITINDIVIPPQLTKSSNDVFNIQGDHGKATLTASITSSTPNPNQLNELGVFNVDDANGKIDGLNPGDVGYAAKALGRAKVLFSTIANLPNGFTNSDVKRSLQLDFGANIRFYVAQGNTTQSIITNGNYNDVLFSSNQNIQTLSNNAFTLKFPNLEVKVEAKNDSLDSGLLLTGQGQQGSTKGDLLYVTDKVNATFSVNREAAYNDFVGFYQVTDETGTIKINDALYKPGDSGYAQAAINSRVAGVTGTNQVTITSNGKFSSNSIFAPFIIVNGDPSTYVNNGNSVYFTFLGANPSSDKQVDHLRLLGNNTFGFEDLPTGGDKDYNDLIVRIALT